jgi:hypothetical protein
VLDVCPALTWTGIDVPGLNPLAVAVTVWIPGEAFIVKTPLALAATGVPVPSTLTRAPGIAAPPTALTTLPEMVPPPPPPVGVGVGVGVGVAVGV